MIDKTTLAILLLTAPPQSVGASPLTANQFETLKTALENSLQFDFCDLVEMSEIDILSLYKIPKTLGQKIFKLLSRAKECEPAIQRIIDCNIKIIDETKDDFPHFLFEKLQNSAPKILFVFGDSSFLTEEMAAVVGTRTPSESAKKFAKNIGTALAEDKKILVTGGANGCDYIATKACIQNGGRAVWFTAVPMNEIIKDKTIAKWISQKKLCLLTTDFPFNAFSGKKALERNHYIFACADSGIVCECKGTVSGTYSGAHFCLKNKLCPLFVYNTGSSGSEQLLKNGGIEIFDD